VIDSFFGTAREVEGIGPSVQAHQEAGRRRRACAYHDSSAKPRIGSAHAAKIFKQYGEERHYQVVAKTRIASRDIRHWLPHADGIAAKVGIEKIPSTG